MTNTIRRPCARQRQGRDHPHTRVMANFKPLPQVDRLQQLFDYRPDTGVFIRKSAKGNCSAGKVAGCRDHRGYLRIRIDRKQYLAHRLAWLYMTKEDPAERVVDHANGDPSDNRFCNLRICTYAENNQNSSMRRNNKSGFKGVDLHRGKWRAGIRVNNVYKYLGSFLTPEQAYAAYCKAAAELHGDFARAA